MDGESHAAPARTWRLAAGLAAASAGAAGALALGNWLTRLGVGEPEPPMSGETGFYPWTQGAVRYTVKGRGEPLALIHGIYPGASSFEYRKIFDRLAERYRVFALDLLGFGQSGRPAIDYTPALYVELIEDFLRQVVGATDHPAHVIASGMSAAYVIMAAARHPAYFSGLVLIEPVGLPGDARPVGRLALGARRALLRSPLIGEGLYNLAVSRPGLRLRLGNSAYSGAQRGLAMTFSTSTTCSPTSPARASLRRMRWRARWRRRSAPPSLASPSPRCSSGDGTTPARQ